MMRVRVRFSKRGKVRWTSHRDVARMWERAFRRTGLPVAYTAGFTPRPRASFGLALPTGCESVAEYLDVDLTESIDLPGLPERLSNALPVGVDALAALEVEDSAGSLQEVVSSCSWSIEVVGSGSDEVEAAVEATLAARSVEVARQRKGRQFVDDIRPAIISLEASGVGAGVALEAELATRPRGVRPAELLAAMGAVAGSELELGMAVRRSQWIERDGARWEPVPLGATGAPHAMERVS